jgi:hypothetical protein
MIKPIGRLMALSFLAVFSSGPRLEVAAHPPDGVAAQTTDPVLVGAGDISNCSRTQDESTGQLLDGIAGTVFTLGDNAYPDGTLDQFNTCYEPAWGRHQERTRPSANHAYLSPGRRYYSYRLTAFPSRRMHQQLQGLLLV